MTCRNEQPQLRTGELQNCLKQKRKASDKLRVVREWLAKLNNGRQGAKELRVHKNLVAGMMECYRYWHVQHIKTDGK